MLSSLDYDLFATGYDDDDDYHGWLLPLKIDRYIIRMQDLRENPKENITNVSLLSKKKTHNIDSDLKMCQTFSKSQANLFLLYTFLQRQRIRSRKFPPI